MASRAMLVCVLLSALLLSSSVIVAEEATRAVGRVVDEEGRPVVGAAVTFWTYAAGALRDAFGSRSTTDAEGRFELPLPFSDVRYILYARRTGYTSQTVPILADGAQVTITLKKHPTHALKGVVLDGETGAAVAGADVTFVAEDELRIKTKSNEAGEFEVGELPEYIGQSVIYAASGKRISALKMVRGGDRQVVLTLGEPAQLRGRLLVAGEGKPAADCTVLLRPYFSSGLELRTVSDAEGRFEFKHLPPQRYRLWLASLLFCDPRAGSHWSDLPLSAGGSGFLEIPVERTASVRGRVLRPDGTPAVNAVVGVVAGRNPYSGQTWDTVRTDENGAFALRTGQFDAQEGVHTFSGRDGCGSAPLPVLKPGQEHAGVTIQLAGAVRIRGVATDPAGNPVAGVWVTAGAAEQVRAQSDGPFDLGFVPIDSAAEREMPVSFIAPRPPFDQRDKPVEGPIGPFYHHKRAAVPATPGQEVALKEQLQPADVVKLAGRVVDHEGHRVARAEVVVLQGKEEPDALQEVLRPPMLWAGSIEVKMKPRPRAACRSVSDGDGNWRAVLVAESAEDLKIAARHTSATPDFLTVGAQASNGATGATQVAVAAPDEQAKDVKVQLGAPPVAGVVSGRVVDMAGHAMAGVELGILGDGPSCTTDADGAFTIGGLHAGPQGDAALDLKTEGWSIVSPDADYGGRRIRVAGAMAGVRGLRVVLGKPGTIVGQVRRDDGRPVWSFQLSSQLAGAIAPNVSPRDGRFRWENVAPGLHRIGVSTPEGVSTTVQCLVEPEREATVEIFLPALTSTLRGQVLPAAGEPMGQVVVEVQCPKFAVETLPDEEGRFSVRVPQGMCRVWAKSIRTDQPQTHPTLDVEVAAGQATEVKYALQPKAAFERRPVSRRPPRRTADDLKREVAALEGVRIKWEDPVQKELTWFALERGIAVADSAALELKRYQAILDQPETVVNVVAFNPDRVWVGTRNGLLVWNRQDRFWSRYAIGKSLLDAPVTELTIKGDELHVTVGPAEAKRQQFILDLKLQRWREP